MKDNPIVLSDSLKAHFERFKVLLVKGKENFLKNEIAASFVKRWLANGNYFRCSTRKKSTTSPSQRL